MIYNVREGDYMTVHQPLPVPDVNHTFEALPAGTYELYTEKVEDGWIRLHVREVSNPYAPRTVRALNVRYTLDIQEVTP